MPAYEIWVHKELHEFAVRLENGQVTGVRPISLHVACDPAGRLPQLEYDDSPAALYRFLEYPEQFFEFEPTLQARYVPVRPPRK